MKNQPASGRVKILRPKRRHSRLRKLVQLMQYTVLLLFGIGIGVGIGTFVSVSQELPKITGYTPPEATKIFSSDNVLLATVGEVNREFVGIKEVPKNLANATVAIEDRRFYDHAGVDFRGIVRAFVTNVRGGEISQGGSTITQQLARNVYLTQKKTFTRKAREAVLAILIERNYTKPKILELYMNQVFYGSGAFGVEAAAKVYFGKNASQLNLSESALLAGLPNRPSDLSPHNNVEAAVERRNLVLSRMQELGYITAEERERAEAQKPKIIPLKPSKYRSKAPYFTDYVKRYLREQYNFGDDMIYRDGLRVYTTVNSKMQFAAQEALTKGIAQARRSGQMNPQFGNGALICIEPSSGYIRAMVGGADYEKSEFNRAVQAKRQPGSSFKAFVYTAAIDTLGWDTNHILPGGHFSRTDDLGRTWSPRNYNGRYPTNVTLRRAVAESINIPAIQAAEKVGLYTVIKYARLLGVKAKLEPYPAMAIGGIPGIRVIEMAGAYGVFAAGGYYVEPNPIAKITDSKGALIDEPTPEPRRVLNEKTVGTMDDLFRGVVASAGGTGYAVRSIPEARGKTGTTNEDVDAWFLGYVPKKLVTAVWVGNDNYKPMKRVWGGNVCAPIWKEFMQTALKIYDDTHRAHVTAKKPEKPRENNVAREQQPRTEEKPPEEVESEQPEDETELTAVRVRVCDESQLLATRWCPSWHREAFVEGTQPTSYCNIHGSRDGGGAGGGTENVEPPEQPATGGGGQLRMTPPPPILSDR